MWIINFDLILTKTTTSSYQNNNFFVKNSHVDLIKVTNWNNCCFLRRLHSSIYDLLGVTDKFETLPLFFSCLKEYWKKRHLTPYSWVSISVTSWGQGWLYNAKHPPTSWHTERGRLKRKKNLMIHELMANYTKKNSFLITQKV